MSTLTGLEPGTASAATWARRAMLAALVLGLAAGLAGVLGVSTREATATGGGYDLTVKYPAVARAGLDVRWQVRVERAGGFDDTLTLAVTGDYFDIFETQGFEPDPDTQTRNGSTWLLTFTAPSEGTTFLLDYDAYIQPASQQGRDASVSVIEDGDPVVTVSYRTRLVP